MLFSFRLSNQTLKDCHDHERYANHTLDFQVRECLEVLELPENIPLAEILICTGFFMVYLIEEVVLQLAAMMDKRKKPDRTVRSFSVSSRSSIVKELAEAERALQASAGHGHNHGGAASTVSDLLIVIALSFHAVFEGLAIGLESDAVAVWTLYGGNMKRSNR